MIPEIRCQFAVPYMFSTQGIDRLSSLADGIIAITIRMHSLSIELHMVGDLGASMPPHHVDLASPPRVSCKVWRRNSSCGHGGGSMSDHSTMSTLCEFAECKSPFVNRRRGCSHFQVRAAHVADRLSLCCGHLSVLPDLFFHGLYPSCSFGSTVPEYRDYFRAIRCLFLGWLVLHRASGSGFFAASAGMGSRQGMLLHRWRGTGCASTFFGGSIRTERCNRATPAMRAAALTIGVGMLAISLSSQRSRGSDIHFFDARHRRVPTTATRNPAETAENAYDSDSSAPGGGPA